MPTIFSHPAVPIGLAIALGSANVSGRLLAAGVVASVLPDLDVLGFRLGIAYSHELGHRGFTHSLAFAMTLAILAMVFANRLKSRPLPAFAFVLVACASHGLLDMLTTGGHGIALFWPFSEERFFWPTQVIEVSTLNLRRFFGAAGLAVLGSELRWVWLPAAVLAAVGYALRRRNAA
jgi:inner membrane protein